MVITFCDEFRFFLTFMIRTPNLMFTTGFYRVFILFPDVYCVATAVIRK